MLLFLPLLFTVTVCAEDTDEEVPKEFSALLEALPESVRLLLPEGLFSGAADDFGEAVTELSEPQFFLDTLLGVLGLQWRELLRLLTTTLGILLLSATLVAMQGTLRDAGTARMLSFVSSLALLSAIAAEGYSGIETTVSYLSLLNDLTAASIPLLGVLYTLGGNVTVAAASSGGLTVYMTVLENLVGRTIVPFCSICLAFAWLGASDCGLRLGSLLATLKKNYTTLLSFLMMLLLTMLTSQSVLGAKADTLAMRSVKFAAGSILPVVGGSVGELLRTVSAGVGYLRGSIGICGILLLILTLLPTLVRLLLLRGVWQLSASVAELLGCDREKRLLDELSSINGYLAAAVAICSSVLLISMAFLAHCASAIG